MEKIEEYIIMHLKAMFLPYLFDYVRAENYLEYTIGNIFDRPFRQRRKETIQQYLERITPAQAVRITRYNYLRCSYKNAKLHVSRPDFSGYEEKSRKLLEEAIDTLFMVEDQWRNHYHNALRRK